MKVALVHQGALFNDDIEQYIKSTSILIVPDNEMVVDRVYGEGYSAISSYTK